MSQETFFIGSAPYEEDCAQTTDPNFTQQNMLECRVYMEQLLRVFGVCSAKAFLAIKAQSHDFGTYREVVVNFNPDDPDAEKYAIEVEGGIPKWDETALEQLKGEKN
jgi:hypothetical protein